MKPNNTNARTAFPIRGAAVLFATLLALTGCSTIKGWFGGKNDKQLEPAELVDFAPSVQVAALWSGSAGEGEGRLWARQAPAIADGRVYAAAVQGGVSARDLATGQSLWHYESDLQLTGGPGVGDGIVAVGGLEGDVIALDAATGAEKWRAKVHSEVLSAPSVGQGMVLVRSSDGRVTAFDEATGERRWFWEHETPTLSVRGTGGVLLGPGYVFVGNDDGKLSALTLADGRLVWEQVVAEADGRNELDRMADIDGTPVLEDTTLYATSFKRKTMAIDGPSGRPLWVGDAGGAGRVAVAPSVVVVTDPDGTVWGLDKATGSAMWQQDGLERRNVTAPAIQGDYAVVGDFDGYLHWLKLSDGAFAARVDAGDAIRATPVVSADGVLVAEAIDGGLAAYRLK